MTGGFKRIHAARSRLPNQEPDDSVPGGFGRLKAAGNKEFKEKLIWKKLF